jgi:hypothetical protein
MAHCFISDKSCKSEILEISIRGIDCGPTSNFPKLNPANNMDCFAQSDNKYQENHCYSDWTPIVEYDCPHTNFLILFIYFYFSFVMLLFPLKYLLQYLLRLAGILPNIVTSEKMVASNTTVNNSNNENNDNNGNNESNGNNENNGNNESNENVGIPPDTPDQDSSAPISETSIDLTPI